jgi:hypothetical protein
MPGAGADEYRHSGDHSKSREKAARTPQPAALAKLKSWKFAHNANGNGSMFVPVNPLKSGTSVDVLG